jgi:hypothetical protein
MRTELHPTRQTLPAPTFRWRDSTGVFHDPAGMATRHLFFTLRMIWNHSMPASARLYPFKGYTFGSFYGRQYMLDAVKALAVELSTRKDITADWQRQLDHMVAWLSTHQVEHDAQPTALISKPSTH